MNGIARRWIRSRRTASASIALGAFALVALARSIGWLEGLELGAFDRLLRARDPLVLDDNPVVLIRLREQEIQEYGHPLCDARLALALAKLQALGASAIGVDIYRDVPIEPCAGRARDAGLRADDAALAEVALRDDRVVMVAKPLEEPPIAPPAFLIGTDQIAVSDIPVDENGIVHRALIYYVFDGEPHFSLSFQLAARHLREHGIEPVNDPERPEWIRLGETAIPMFGPDEGGYHAADAGGYQYLLDYRLGQDAFPSFTLEELYADAIPASAMRGRIAILGTDSTTVKDRFSTPLSAGLPGNPFMLGMELHAHAATQLIRIARGEAAPIVGWGPLEDLAWIGLWCALGGALGHWSRSPWWSAGAALAAIAALGMACRIALANGLWIPLVPALLGGAGAAGLVTAYRAFRERAERSELAGLFSKFLRPEVAKAIWEQRDAFMGPDGRPRAGRTTLTTLMTDLKGYTTASESMEPEALMSWINEYMLVMADLIGAHDGVVDDYAGDGIKANFGFPIPRTSEQAVASDARNAVRCALAMGAALDRLNADWRARGLPTGRARIGICTGPAVVGILGGRESMKYTTVGDTVNTAARLESFAKDEFDSDASNWRVLVNEATMRHLDGSFRAEDLGAHALKGKHESIRIFRVLGATQASKA